MAYYFWLGYEAENYMTPEDWAEAYAWADRIRATLLENNQD